MAKTRLIERIANSSCRPTDAPEAVRQSIIKNILNILQTEQASVPIREDLGLPQYNNIVQVDPCIIKNLLADIQYQVQTFEPRLDDLQINFEDKKQVIFMLQGSFNYLDKNFPLYLKLTYNKQGRLQQV